MTAYGLLAILEAGLYADGLPVLKWLLNQRNDHGGFQSTQDTILGLRALSKFAERISTANNNVQIELKYNQGMQSRININRDNSLILQTYEVIVINADISFDNNSNCNVYTSFQTRLER